jgi:hypothetical protein
MTVAFPANAAFGAAGPDAVAAVDLNYDFRTDLVFAGASGLQIFRQTEQGGFTAVTAEARLPADVTGVPLHAVWPADIDTDGDLDLVVAPRDGAVRVLRKQRRRHVCRPVPVRCAVARARLRVGRFSTAKACPTRPCSTIRESSGSFSTSADRRSANEPFRSVSQGRRTRDCRTERRWHRRRPRHRAPMARSPGSRRS